MPYIIDDLMNEVSECVDIKKLFTRGRHNTSIIFLTPNLFHKDKHTRTMSLTVITLCLKILVIYLILKI